MTTRSVVTIAFGNAYYLELAINLARSFLYWHPLKDIEFCLVTDRPQDVPPDVAKHVRVLGMPTDTVGPGFSFKLHLDEFLHTDRALYVDGDCLCFGHLGDVFQRFEGIPLGVVGTPIRQGDFWGNVAKRCDLFQLACVPELMGSVYYMERGAASVVFETARALELRYEELGMLGLRGGVNDEPLISMSVAIHDLPYLPEDGLIKADIDMYANIERLDVLGGRASLQNGGRMRWDGRAYPNQVATPLIVHFNWSHSEQWYYNANAFALRMNRERGWPVWLCRAVTVVLYVIPGRTESWLKGTLRPLYRRLFGTRRIRPAARVKGGDPLTPQIASSV